MGMNPFAEKSPKIFDTLVDIKTLATQPYDKRTVDPYTRLRAILMNGTEFESVWLGHQFSRSCDDNDLRRELALIRRVEQQQQKRISALKPADETVLEHTIGYEQLAVDLTACMARCEPDGYVKAALDFALLEDFDHLYRYSDLLEGEHGVAGENIVGHYTEIMPGRPTISEHRHPFDSIRYHITAGAAPITKLHVNIITAAEQQTMNYYMNQAAFYTGDLGRNLYSEIAMIEEQHVTHYGSLKDASCTWLEKLLMHEYTECYLYYSCYMSEKDARIKQLWEELFVQETAHLQTAARLLEKYERKQWQQLFPSPDFPALLDLGPNKEYVRGVLASQAELTAFDENYKSVHELPADYRFFAYQGKVTPDAALVPSHQVIARYIARRGQDYRYQVEEHPVPALADRTQDNTTLGRVR